MDPARLGADVRTLRRRRGWTQSRLATAAGVGRWTVSELECGRGGATSIDAVSAVVAALGGYVSLRILYHGEALDRLRDRDHAQIVERLVARLRRHGWNVATEVTFNVFGDRGAIDILAFHPFTGALLVIEVKTVIPDVGGMLAGLDRKARYAAQIAAERGWIANSVSKLLVVRDGTTTRRRVREQAETFMTTFPIRGREVTAWLRRPSGSIAGLWFLPSAGRPGKRRVKIASGGGDPASHAQPEPCPDVQPSKPAPPAGPTRGRQERHRSDR